jgi:hypothetical protein
MRLKRRFADASQKSEGYLLQTHADLQKESGFTEVKPPREMLVGIRLSAEIAAGRHAKNVQEILTLRK